MVNNPGLLGCSSLSQRGSVGGMPRGLSVGLLLEPVPAYRKNGIFSGMFHLGRAIQGRGWG